MFLSFANRRPVRSHKRLIDFVLYIAIGSVFIAIALFVGLRWGSDAFIRWGGLAGYTAILFGYFVTDSRAILSEPSILGTHRHAVVRAHGSFCRRP